MYHALLYVLSHLFCDLPAFGVITLSNKNLQGQAADPRAGLQICTKKKKKKCCFFFFYKRIVELLPLKVILSLLYFDIVQKCPTSF